ncbi:hypothetical protein H0E84_15695 [Luteimonas sp. SJ-92]|uniref:Uncharacterized protein n=1 Tax=Luteimonas salinisoli TaxID=2752307 RepID=A0A853JER1_9GAMM|nr:hypothetical protein [Luteimonas salinisoli]NZA27821.1 hypothetical protein [Luteimonas salinisoli]
MQTATMPRFPPTSAVLATLLGGALFLGAVALLSLPPLRTGAFALGAAPLWLLGMPLASLAALAIRHLATLSRRRSPASSSSPGLRRLRPSAPQARKRPAMARPRLPRAA